MKRSVARGLGLLLAAVLLLSLCACGGGGGSDQAAMADSIVKETVEAFGSDAALYNGNYLVFTPTEDGKGTYAMMSFYRDENGQAREESVMALFDGETLSQFAAESLDGETYNSLRDAMPVNNTEEFAKAEVIETACMDNGVKSYAQAQEDLGV